MVLWGRLVFSTIALCWSLATTELFATDTVTAPPLVAASDIVAPSKPLEASAPSKGKGPFSIKTETIDGKPVRVFRLNLPPFDQLPLQTKIDFQAGLFEMRSFPTDKSVGFGPIELKKPELVISNKDGVVLSAGASFLGKETTASLSLYAGPTAELKLSLKDPLRVPLSDTRDLFSLESVAARKKPQRLEIVGQGTLLGSPDPNAEMIFDAQTRGASLTIKKLALGDFIEPIQDTPLGKVALKDTKASIDDLRLLKKRKHMITLKGRVDVNDGIPALESMGDVDFNFTYLADGAHYAFETSLNDIPLGDVGVLRQLKLGIKSNGFDAVFEKRKAEALGIIAEEDPTAGAQTATASTTAGPATAAATATPVDSGNPTQAQAPPTSATPPAGKARPTITALGKADLNLPLGLGQVQAEMDAEFSNEFQRFSASLGKDMEYNGIGIKNVKLIITKRIKDSGFGVKSGVFKPTTDVRFEGNATFGGADVIGAIDTYKDVNGKDVYEFSTTLRNELYPFREVPGIDEIPGVKDICLRNVSAGFNTQKEAFFSGETTIMGITSSAKVRKRPEGVMLSMILPHGITIGEIIPPARGSFAESLGFSKAALYFSSFTGKDPDTDIRISKGFSFVAQMDFTAPMFDDARKILPVIPKFIVISANADTETQSFLIGAHIPVRQSLGPLELSNFILELGLKQARPIFAFLIDMNVRPPCQDELLNLVGRIELSAIGSVMVAATMQGFWRNPLGIPGFKVGNLAVEAGLMVEPPWLKDFGYAGSIQIGKTAMSTALKIDLEKPDRVAFLGSLSELSLGDIVDFANDVLKEITHGSTPIIPAEAVPPLGISDFEYKMVPQTTTIGEIVLQKGVTLKGALNLFGFHAGMLFNVDGTGIIAKGWMDKISLGGVIEVKRGSMQNVKEAPPGEGPYIDVALTPFKQNFIVSGAINFMFIQQQTDIYISPKKIYFDVSMDIWSIFKGQVHAESLSGDGSSDFVIKIVLEQKLLDWLKNEAAKQLEILYKEADKKISEAQAQLDKINDGIKKVDDQEEDFKRQVTGLTAQMNRKVEDARGKVRDAQQKVTNARKDVDKAADKIKEARNKVESLQRDIDDTNKTLDRLKREINSSIIDLVPLDLLDDEKGSILYAADKYHMAAGMPLEFMYYTNQLLALDNSKIHTLSTVYEHYAGGAKEFFEDVGNKINDHVIKPAGKAFQDAGNAINDKVIKPAVDGINKGVDKIRLAAEITAQGTKLAGLQVAYNSAKGVLIAAEETTRGVGQGALDAANGTLKAAEAAAVLAGTEEAAQIAGLQIAIGGCEASKGTMQGAKIAANATLEGVKQATKGVCLGLKSALESAPGQKLLDVLASGFNIRRVSIETRASELAHGKLPRLTLDATIFGKDRSLDLQVDVVKLATDGKDEIVKGIVSLFT